MTEVVIVAYAIRGVNSRKSLLALVMVESTHVGSDVNSHFHPLPELVCFFVQCFHNFPADVTTCFLVISLLLLDLWCSAILVSKAQAVSVT